MLLQKSFANIFTFTRASKARDFDAYGLLSEHAVDAIRQGYDPATGAPAGWRLEGAATNLLQQSSAFNFAPWNSILGGMASNAVAAPDGTTTADTLTLGAAVSHHLYQIFTVTPATTYAFSIWVRLGTLPASYFSMAFRDDTAAVFIAEPVAPAESLTAAAWTRVRYVLTTPAGCTTLRVYPYRHTATTGGTVHLWGAQCEANYFASSYIPTTTAATTRAADNLSITDSAFASIFGSGAPQGFVIVDVLLPQSAGATEQAVLQVDAGTNNDRLLIRNNANGSALAGFRVTAGAGSSGVAMGSLTAGAPFRVGVAWANGLVRFVGPSGAVVSHTGAPTSFSFVRFGAEITSRHLNGRIRMAAAGAIAPTDAKFQAACVLGANIDAALRS